MKDMNDLTLADMDRPEVALKLRVELIDSLLDKVVPMPDLEDLDAVKAYFERAHELALPNLKEFVKEHCKAYLEDLR